MKHTIIIGCNGDVQPQLVEQVIKLLLEKKVGVDHASIRTGDFTTVLVGTSEESGAIHVGKELLPLYGVPPEVDRAKADELKQINEKLTALLDLLSPDVADEGAVDAETAEHAAHLVRLIHQVVLPLDQKCTTILNLMQAGPKKRGAAAPKAPAPPPANPPSSEKSDDSESLAEKTATEEDGNGPSEQPDEQATDAGADPEDQSPSEEQPA